MRWIPARVPGGFARDGSRQREFHVRSLVGFDERALVVAERTETRESRETRLLARCVSRSRGRVPLGRGVARELAAGDREALLLQVRGATLGDRIACLARCKSCGETFELETRTEALLLAPYAHEGSLPTSIPDGGHTLELRIRAITGGHLEELARGSEGRAGLRAREALRACLAPPVPEAAVAIESWPEDVRASVERLIESVDPQAEIVLEASCPSCQHGDRFPLHAMELFEAELGLDRRQLDLEVHILASHYHWSERVILALPFGRRQRYLDYIGASTEATR